MSGEPFFSPDGQQLGFWGSDGQMKKVSITGGAPVALGSAPVWASGASWADDGYIYFGQGAGGILRVSEDGGEPEPVVEMEEGEQAHGPQLLPGGEWVLFTLSSDGSWNDASIVAQPVSGGESRVLVARGTDGRYVPTGHIVYTLEGNLFESPDIKVGRSQRTGTTCAVSPAHLSSSNNHRLNTLRRLLAAAEQAPQPERGLRRRPSTEARKYCSGRSQKNP